MNCEMTEHQKRIGALGQMHVENWLVELRVIAHRQVFGRHDYYVRQVIYNKTREDYDYTGKPRWVSADRIIFDKE